MAGSAKEPNELFGRPGLGSGSLDAWLGCVGSDRNVGRHELAAFGVAKSRPDNDMDVVDGLRGQTGSRGPARRQQVGVEVFEVFGPRRLERDLPERW